MSPKKLRTMAGNTDDGRKSRSKKIDIQLNSVSKKFVERYDHWNVFFMFEAQSQSDPGKSYSVIIQTIEDVGINEDNWKQLAKGNIPMSCSCECKDFVFRQEYALAQSENSMIKNSNGKYPDVTNPDLKKYVCKHILAAYDLLKKVVRQTDFEDIQDIEEQDYYDK